MPLVWLITPDADVTLVSDLSSLLGPRTPPRLLQRHHISKPCPKSQQEVSQPKYDRAQRKIDNYIFLLAVFCSYEFISEFQ